MSSVSSARRKCPSCDRVYADDTRFCAKDGSELLEIRAVDPLTGTLIAGRYRVQSLIASGGMGKVFRAEQTSMGRFVAVKVLHTGRETDPSSVARFEREVQAISGLQSPHTVRIFDFGRTSSGSLFMVMELLEGRSLHQRIVEGGALTPSETLHVLDGVARSLGEAHAAGIVHRDLTPSNIFLARTRDYPVFPKVLDFGIAAREEDRGNHLTQSGTIVGTPAYIAPERIRGVEARPASDIYSLGLVAYACLTGKPPFDATTGPTLFDMHLRAQPAPLPPSVPTGLRDLVMRCLAKSPNLRPQDADAFRTELDRIAAPPPDGVGAEGGKRPAVALTSSASELPETRTYPDGTPADSGTDKTPTDEGPPRASAPDATGTPPAPHRVTGPTVASPLPQDVTGPTAASPRAQDISGPTVASPRSQDVTGPTVASPLPQDVTGPTLASPRPQDVTGPTLASPRLHDVTGPSPLPHPNEGPIPDSAQASTPNARHDTGKTGRKHMALGIAFGIILSAAAWFMATGASRDSGAQTQTQSGAVSPSSSIPSKSEATPRAPAEPSADASPSAEPAWAPDATQGPTASSDAASSAVPTSDAMTSNAASSDAAPSDAQKIAPTAKTARRPSRRPSTGNKVSAAELAPAKRALAAGRAAEAERLARRVYMDTRSSAAVVIIAKAKCVRRQSAAAAAWVRRLGSAQRRKVVAFCRDRFGLSLPL